jgi:hypothetical protein
MWRAKAKFTVGCRGVEDAQDTPADTSFQAKTSVKVALMHDTRRRKRNEKEE